LILAAALVAFVAWFGAGCAVNRPEFLERTTGTNGVTSERRLTVSTWSLWPASTDLAKQKASLGKTFTLGTSELGQDSGGTNVVETLRALDSILGKVRP
jgi:hypothetical protein